MGQKVHPYGFRLGIIRKSRSRWFAEGTEYRDQLLADMAIRKFITDNHRNAGLSDIIIERTASNVSVTIQTAKPGIIIGRGGRDVDVLRQAIEKKVGGRVRLNVEETPDPDINAQLIAENIAGQIERRVSHRRAMQQAIERAMRMGALGARAKVSGRLSGAEIARTESLGPVGRVPLHTLRADVEYGMASAATAYGNIGVKVWVYKGEILPPRKVERTRTGEYEAGPSAEDWERVAAAARHTHPGQAAEDVELPEAIAEPVVEAAAAEVIAPEIAEEPIAEAPVAEVESAESAPEAPGEQEATQDVDA